MSQVSPKKVPKNIENKIEQLILASITHCSSQNIARQFLEDLLSPTEKIMVSKRLAIAYLLLKGHPYETIKSTLKVSNPTIGTVSRQLKQRGGGLRKILFTISKQEQLKNIFEEIASAAIHLLGSGKGAHWKQTKQFEFQNRIKRQSPL